MWRDFLRILGTSCILSGSILYLTSSPSPESDPQAANTALKHEIAALETKLQKTEAELANLQTLSSEANQPDDNRQVQQSEDVNPKQDSIISTILHIEAGTTSKDVAKELANASIIKDAEELNVYLKAHNLAKKIQIGEYKLDSSMSIETIANKITTKK